jgi:hypothetical protein
LWFIRPFADDPRHYHEIGRPLESQEFLDVAERTCTDLLRFYPLNYTIETDETPTESQINDVIAEIYHTRGCLAAEINRPKEALSHHMAFNDMLVKQFGTGPARKDMRLGISWYQLGTGYMANKDWARGEECFTKAIRVMKQLDDFQDHQITLPMVNLGIAHWSVVLKMRPTNKS